MKCNETVGKWCKNKHGASKIIDTLETYQLLQWAFLREVSRLAAGVTSTALAAVIGVESVAVASREIPA
jgi:hypothetical protein